MSLRAQIILVVSIPFLALLGFGSLKISEGWNGLTGSERAQQETQASLSIINLVHYLQVERGQSAGFISSDGNAFADEIHATRAAVDKAREHVPEGSMSTLDRLKELDAVRTQVDAQSLTVAQMAKFYTSTIGAMLSDVGTDLVEQDDATLAQIGGGLVSLSYAKEAAGLQRAAGASGFGSGQFSLGAYKMFAENGASETQLLQTANLALLSVFPDLNLQGSQAYLDLSRIRAEVLASGPLGEVPSLSGPEWFALSTAWISELHPAISVHASPGDPVGEGHRHVIYPDDSGPLVSFGEPDANTGAKFIQRMKGQRALIIPHHTAWSGTDWDAHDPELQRVVEVVSAHGRFEEPDNLPIGYRRDHLHPKKFIQEALDRGYRLGFVGGSDSHGLRWHAIELEGRAKHIPHGTRVGWKEDAYRTGMTVVLAPELTRSAIYEALYDRRCYATSGVPIRLMFSINDAIMGSEIQTQAAPTIQARAAGSGPIRSIELIRSGTLTAALHAPAGMSLTELSATWTDELMIPGESHYFYVRVIQEDGNMAWSSPIWVTYT